MTQISQVGIPERRGLEHWWVPSGTAGVGYTVERLEGRWRCTCPSFRWRKIGTCKHIAAVRRLLAQAVEA
jgi:SWIM zinc finger